MDRKQLQQIGLYLKRNAPILEGNQPVRSHRYEDEVTEGGDSHSYHDIACFIQKGLGGHQVDVRQVLQTVAGFQQYGNRSYRFWLFSFGWDDGKIRCHPRAVDISWQASAATLSRALCALAGDGPTKESPVVPALSAITWPVAEMVGWSPEDLRVFFCSNRSVKLEAPLQRRYKGLVQQRSVWVFLAEQSVGVEAGTFVPECVETGDNL